MKKIILTSVIIGFVFFSCNQKTDKQAVEKNNEITVIEPVMKKPLPLTDDQYRKWNDKLLSGIDFIASGNEPFWTLEIDLDKMMKFKTVGGDSINTSAVKGIRLMDVAATSYRAQTEAGLLNVVIYDQKCVNDMSGDTLPKKVEVSFNEKKYSGCGRYLADYRLHDIWVLKTINDTAVNEKELRKGAPTLEINLATNKLYGHGGCNNINGTVEAKGKYIRFSRIASTRMACDDNGFESRYLAALSEKEMRYKVENGTLTLQAGDSIFSYRKID